MIFKQIPENFHNPLLRKLIFLQSGRNTFMGTRIFFVPMVYNAVPIRQDHTKTNVKGVNFELLFRAVIECI